MDFAMGFTKYNLILIGVWPDPRVTAERSRQISSFVFWSTVFVTIMFVSLPQMSYLLLRSTNLDEAIENLSINAPVLFSLSKHASLRRHRKTLSLLLEQLLADWSSPHSKSDHQVMLKNAKISRLISIVLSSFTYIMFVAFMALQVTSSIENTSMTDSKALLHPSIFPYDTGKSPNLQVTWMGQIMGMASMTLCYSSFDTFLAVLVLHLCGQLSILRNALEDLANRNHQTKFRDRIVYIVHRHNELTRFAVTVEECFNLMLLVQTVMCTLMFCMTGYRLINSVDQEEDKVSIFEMIFCFMHVTNSMLHFFVYCYVGEMLVQESTGIAQSAYDCIWYDLPPKQAALMITIIHRAGESLKITAGKFSPLSFELFNAVSFQQINYKYSSYASNKDNICLTHRKINNKVLNELLAIVRTSKPNRWGLIKTLYSKHSQLQCLRRSCYCLSCSQVYNYKKRTTSHRQEDIAQFQELIVTTARTVVPTRSSNRLLIFSSEPQKKTSKLRGKAPSYLTSCTFCMGWKRTFLQKKKHKKRACVLSMNCADQETQKFRGRQFVAWSSRVLMDFERDLRDAIGWNRFNLRIVGIWPEPAMVHERIADFRAFVSVFCVMIFVNVWQSADLFMVGNDLSQITSILSLANIPGYNSVIKLIFVWYYRKDLQPLIKSFYDDWHAPKTEEERRTMVDSAKLCNSLSIWCTVLTQSMLVAYIGTRSYAIATCDINTEPSDHLTIYPAYYPIDLRRTLFRVAVNVAQVIAAYCAVIPYTSVDIFIATLVLHTCGQFTNLHRKLENLMDESNGKNVRNSSDIREELASIVKRHEHLNWAAARIDDCFSMLLFLQMLFSTVEICFQGFLFFNVILTSDEGMLNFQLVFFVLFISFVIVHMFVYCYVGELLRVQSSNMAVAAYESRWYNVAPPEAKCLVFVMLRSKRPLCLTAGKFGTFSMEMFSTILRTAMGYLSVLVTVSSVDN
ncbi:uncharacterized protein LOC143361007 [Halictus rubicundus]|uniref:uncharacterized protein LOC143361007 n=1 Tax=Halictus rubicundus TaxID=77578 RepID=UPI004037357D